MLFGNVTNAEVSGNTTIINVVGNIKTVRATGRIEPSRIRENDHSALVNLDYEHSGHTGFQASEEGKGLSTNDFTNEDKTKVDNITPATPAIPNTILSTYTSSGVKYLKVSFEGRSSLFNQYVEDGKVKLYLYKYTKSGTKVWNDVYKNSIKKWVHPANQFYSNNPVKQCWGIRSFSANPNLQVDIDSLMEESEYPIANDGFVKSEYDIQVGQKAVFIPVNDIVSPIIKVSGTGPESVQLPTFGDNTNLHLMGVKQYSRRARCKQPIKFCLAIEDEENLYVGNCLNTATIELFKYRVTAENYSGHGYGSSNYSILGDIGYGVLVK